MATQCTSALESPLITAYGIGRCVTVTDTTCADSAYLAWVGFQSFSGRLWGTFVDLVAFGLPNDRATGIL